MGCPGQGRRRAATAMTGAVGVLGATLLFAAPAYASSIAAGDDEATVGVTSHIAQVNVLSNDTAPDGSPAGIGNVEITGIEEPDSGELTLDDNGLVNYTPQACSPGDFTVTYTIANPADPADTAQGTVTFHVPDGGTPMSAAVDTASVDATGTATGNLLSNDCGITTPASIENTFLNTTPVNAPENGTVTISPDGAFTYTAGDGFTGGDSFTYEIRNAVNETWTSVGTVEVVTATPGETPSTNTDDGDGDVANVGKNVEDDAGPPQASIDRKNLAETGVTAVTQMSIAGGLLLLTGVGLALAARRRRTITS